jgi:hypothetical protein
MVRAEYDEMEEMAEIRRNPMKQMKKRTFSKEQNAQVKTAKSIAARATNRAMGARKSARKPHTKPELLKECIIDKDELLLEAFLCSSNRRRG